MHGSRCSNRRNVSVQKGNLRVDEIIILVKQDMRREGKSEPRVLESKKMGLARQAMA
jgi:hypothetical protein